VERVAKAIAHVQGYEWDDLSAIGLQDVMDDARASIAAAPDLYAACTATIKALSDLDLPFPPALHDRITDALAKAEGRP
jgi:hypothetical protein